MNCILIFDIDGTLVSRPEEGRSAGLRAMNAAAHEMTGGFELANQISFAGATDLSVAAQLLKLGGFPSPTEEQKRTLLDHYVRFMTRFIQEDSYIALGNPTRVIPALRGMGAIIGLGTGNVRAGAHAKLRSAGIETLFNLDLGGYGEDAEERAGILKVAAERCRAVSPPSFTRPLSVVVIGDTQKDIDAAKAIGAKCVGVPFGSSTAQSLLAGGADAVVTEIGNELFTAVEKVIQ